MIIKLLAQFIVFFAALVAIKGETWNKDAEKLRKVTRAGYMTAIFATIGLIVSMKITYDSHQDSKKQSDKLSQVSADAKAVNQKAEDLKRQLDDTNEEASDIQKKLEQSLKNEEDIEEKSTQLRLTLEAAKARIESYESILDVIRSESVRQPQQVMAQYVELRGHGTWTAPNYIYGGSIIKLY